VLLPHIERGSEEDFDKSMGGLGSGHHHLGSTRRRVVERAFALDIGQVLATRLVPGTRGEFILWAPLIAWPVHLMFLIRHVDSFVVTIWFYRPVSGGLVHIPIDVAPAGSHRRRYFVCPRPDHATSAPVLVAKLYWPVNDPGGFACRRCHKLTYRSQQTRREEPEWMRRVRIAAALAAEPQRSDDRSPGSRYQVSRH
jgi:hypothetical protein